MVSVSAGTGRGYRPAEREYPATITPVVAVIQDGVQWHVDVVIVERRSFSIVAAVELDDASHLRPERRRRDILLEEVLRQAGIPLLRSHDARKLLQMTGEWLNTTGADQQSPEHRS